MLCLECEGAVEAAVTFTLVHIVAFVFLSHFFYEKKKTHIIIT